MGSNTLPLDHGSGMGVLKADRRVVALLHWKGGGLSPEKLG